MLPVRANTSFPFKEQVVLRSKDLHEAQEVVNRRFDEREFIPLKSSNTADIIITQQPLGKITLAASRWGTPIEVRSVPLASYHLLIPSNGLVYSHRSRDSISPGEVLIFSPGCSVDLRWESQTQGIVLNLDQTALCEYFKIQGDMLERNRETILSADDNAAQNILNLINFIIRDSSHSQSLLRSERAQQHSEKLLLEALALCVPELDHANSATLLPHLLKQSIEYIQENLHQSIAMSDLVELTGSSRRSLEGAFRKNLQVSPMKYIAQQKLQAVREILQKAHAEEVAVGEVAERFGFIHASHFSAMYQQSFAEKPSDTLKRSN